MSDNLDHDELANLFLSMGALQPPAELHGYAVGFLAIGGRVEREAWLKHCGELLDVETPNPEQGDALFDVYRNALAALSSENLDLQLLLPGDELDLSQRIVSLGQWVQGFLTGFAMAGKQRKGQGANFDALSEDSREALSDLAAIAQISADEAEHEEGEQDLVEISEYVRVVAMSIFLECNRDAPGKGSAARLH
ncbi:MULTISPECIES: UPF0149 family protein [Spongiibacter]|uniref:UPF0149 family protein n=1 Tax=Spongiibacter TaxID=630749 RepID=UPI00048B79A6|nr:MULTISPECIES: UPF0149 family protein [Spongiibacter]MBO6752957.1 UPF0149 family protein [Spongiibacter sp.]